MKRILWVSLALLLVSAGPASARHLGLKAGWSVPNGGFADPARTLSIQKGAESGFIFGVEYVRPLVILDFVAGLSYVQFGEAYTGPPDAPERQEYGHTFIPATVGLRKRFLGGSPLQPFLGSAIGLYGYLATGDVLINEPAGTNDFKTEGFTTVVRPGLQFSIGAVLDVPFTFDLAAELTYHIMIFQGVGDDLTDREYPYTIDADSRNFTTFTVGVLF